MQSLSKQTIIAIVVTAIIVSFATYSTQNGFKKNAVEDGSYKTTVETKELEAKFKKSMAAYECSMWASFGSHKSEYKKLFDIGYKNGGSFVGALRGKSVSQETYKNFGLDKESASLFLEMPSDDFLQGVIFAGIIENTNKKLNEGVDYNLSIKNIGDIVKLNADLAYDKANCGLLEN